MKQPTVPSHLTVLDYIRIIAVSAVIAAVAAFPDFRVNSAIAVLLCRLGVPNCGWAVSPPGHITMLICQIGMLSLVLLLLAPPAVARGRAGRYTQAIRLGLCGAGVVWLGAWVLASIHLRGNFEGRPLLLGVAVWLGGRTVLRVVRHAGRTTASNGVA